MNRRRSAAHMRRRGETAYRSAIIPDRFRFTCRNDFTFMPGCAPLLSAPLGPSARLNAVLLDLKKAPGGEDGPRGSSAGGSGGLGAAL